MRYEVFYLVGASREADLSKIKEEIGSIITAAGGVFEEKETVEKRRLSYKVKHETHGIYVAQRFDLPETGDIKEISNKINLYPNVLRFIISKANDLPEIKSKEERISEATQRENPSYQPKEKPEPRIEPRPKKEKEEEQPTAKKPEPEEEKPVPTDNNDDIDKKLEEILNI